MLTFFATRHVYCSIRVSFAVDLELREASITVSQLEKRGASRILATWDVRLAVHPQLATPEGCAAWCNTPVNVRGMDGEMGRIEAWHHYPHTRPMRVAA